MKSQEITKLTTINPVVDMNICLTFDDNASNICPDISLKTTNTEYWIVTLEGKSRDQQSH